MLSIKGLQKTSLIDYPDRVCCIVFLAGCNFRCLYCQNPDLVLNPEKLPDISEEEILDFMKKRKKFLDGICITGGEPTLHKDLPEFIQKVKKLGFLVKLDTNGTNPKMLKELLDRKLLDYISMDIKGPLEDYSKIAKSRVSKPDIQLSVNLIRKSGIDYEFRTTCVPGLFDKDTAVKIGKWLKGSEKYCLQQFRPLITLDPKYQTKKPHSEERLKEFASLLKPYFKVCEVRA